MRISSLFIAYRKRFHAAAFAVSGLFFFFIPLIIAQAISISPPRLELEGDPGDVIESEFKVTNDTASPQTYYTQIENFEAKDETGSPQFVQSREGLVVWTSVASSVTIQPGQEFTIPFTVRVPRNAEPGGYFASIFVRTTPPPRSGNEVSIGSRLGTLVLLRVNGEIREGVDILEFSTKDKKRFYTSLPVELYYRFQNTGADRVKPEGEVIIKNLVGLKAKVLSANRTDGSVLPRSIRRFDMAWINGGGGEEDKSAQVVVRNPGGFFEEAKYQFSNFAFGVYSANLDITFGANNNTAAGTFRFVVIPWQLLIISAVVLLVLIVVLRFVLRRYNRYIISKHSR